MLAFVVMASVFGPVATPLTAGQNDQTTVLTLQATRMGTAAATQTDQTIERTLRQHFQEDLDYYADFIDLARFSEPEYQDALRDFLRTKYAGRRFDVIIATTNAVLEFVTKYRDALFPDVPIIFSSGSGNDRPPNATGITSSINLRDTLEIAIRLQPNVQRVFVVTGASAWDRHYETLAREQFKAFEGRIGVTYVVGEPLNELLSQAANLPPRSIIYYLSVVEDRAGHSYSAVDVAERVASVANAPVYAWHTVGMGKGIVGGSMQSAEVPATRLAELAVRVIRGEKPDAIPVTNVDPNVIEFDARQLRRWGISERRVPAGSVIQFRQPGIWDQYGRYLVATVSLMILQTALISGLLFQRARRRRTEHSLLENQQRYLLATTAGAVGVWDWNLETNDIYVDPELKRILGYTDDEIPNRMDRWGACVHPDDAPSVMALAQECLDGRTDVYEVEHRMLHKDGTVRWFLARGTAVRLANGTAKRLVGTDIDITERKRAQEALRENEAALRAYNAEIQDLAGRLIESQEAERARIARELHDDVSQQIAALSIAISNLRRRMRHSATINELAAEVAALQRLAIELGAGVRAVSHNLHPGLIQHSGLVAALTDHCAEIKRQTGLTVSLQADDDFTEMPPEHSLCLFRVTQEALRNTVAHAGARRAEVSLSRSRQHAELAVADDGRGFNVAKATGVSGGLGLLSIRERVRLAGGTVSIVSQLQAGTTVRVRIPMGPRPSAD